MESSAPKSKSHSLRSRILRSRILRAVLFIISLFAVGGLAFLYAQHKSQFRALVVSDDGSKTAMELSRLSSVGLFSAATGQPAGLDRTAPYQLLVFFSPGDCSACLEEAHAWNALSAHYDRSRLQVAGVLVRSSLDEARGFKKSYGPTFDLYVDLEQDIAAKVGLPERTPLKVLLDARGKVLMVDGPNYKREQQWAFVDRAVSLVEGQQTQP
ncbi:MAG TPA: redoxin domain-containing protein [Pyrinomonadaceae bacterium]|jgi:peroxiredoxin